MFRSGWFILQPAQENLQNRTAGSPHWIVHCIRPDDRSIHVDAIQIKISPIRHQDSEFGVAAQKNSVHFSDLQTPQTHERGTCIKIDVPVIRIYEKSVGLPTQLSRFVIPSKNTGYHESLCAGSNLPYTNICCHSETYAGCYFTKICESVWNSSSFDSFWLDSTP